MIPRSGRGNYGRSSLIGVTTTLYVARSNAHWQRYAERLLILTVALSGIGAGLSVVALLAVIYYR